MDDEIDLKEIDRLLNEEMRNFYGYDFEYLCNELSKPNITTLLDKSKIFECYKKICTYIQKECILGHECIIDDSGWTGKIDSIKEECSAFLDAVKNLIEQDELSAEEKKRLITKAPYKCKCILLSDSGIGSRELGLNFEQEYKDALVKTVEEFIEYPGADDRDQKRHNLLNNPSYYTGFRDNGDYVNLKGLKDIVMKFEIVRIPEEIIRKYIFEVILFCPDLNPSEYSKRAGAFLDSISKSKNNQMQYSTDLPSKIALDAIYEKQVSGYGNQQLSEKGEPFEIIYNLIKSIANSPLSDIEAEGGFLNGGRYKSQTKRIKTYFLKKYYKWIIEDYLHMTKEEFTNKVLEQEHREYKMSIEAQKESRFVPVSFFLSYIEMPENKWGKQLYDPSDDHYSDER